MFEDFKTTVSLNEDETTVFGNVFAHFFVEMEKTDPSNPLLPRASALLKRILAAQTEQIITVRASANTKS
jgi:hypothetical protein